MDSRLTADDHEKEVRRIAEALWPSFRQQGPINLDERERDGIFFSEETVNIIEATISRREDKAKADITKSIKLARQLRGEHPHLSVRIWFITSDEPTADQNKIAATFKEFPVFTRSLDNFRAQLIDVHAYRTSRQNYPFGSARNLLNESHLLDKNAYVDMGILSQREKGSPLTINQISERVGNTSLRRVILLGDYGTGKSMALREVYLQLDRAFQARTIRRFPIFINLRDHSNQSDPVEVLERHARRLGIPEKASHLVRAWRAGYVVLLLDGFDELASAGWVQFNRQLPQVRFATVEIIRRFLNETDPDTPIIISGRGSYFDSNEECLRALGMQASETEILSLNDFDEEQIEAFLKKYNFEGNLPDWIPARPLLLGYLLIRGFLFTSLDEGDLGAGVGWTQLIDKICAREAATHPNVEPGTIRAILEWLSTLTRAKGSVTAPLSPADMIEAFKAVVGIEPDQSAETLLMRLPGLSAASDLAIGQRSFIDEDLAHAAAAGDVVKFIQDPFRPANPHLLRVTESLSEIGTHVCVTNLVNDCVAAAKISVAGQRAIELGTLEQPQHTLACDIFRLAIQMEVPVGERRSFLKISQVFMESMDLTSVEADFSNIIFEDCLFRNLYLSPQSTNDAWLPTFKDCEIEFLDGRAGLSDLPKQLKSLKCTNFSSAFSTNAAVLATGLSAEMKILAVDLRKLFVQKGSGRKRGAFYRGIPNGSAHLVDRVLAALRKFNFANPTKVSQADEIWLPNRRMTARVKGILQAPASSQDPLVLELKH